MRKPLRVVLADDERPARRFLINLLKSFPDVEVVGEAANGKEAIDLIEAERPDLALLDLHMPETGGLDVARLVKAGATPSIAFVTAHDDFAIEAFELNAIDYLLKPVERERLAQHARASADASRRDAGRARAESQRRIRRARKRHPDRLSRTHSGAAKRRDRDPAGAADLVDRRRRRAAAPDHGQQRAVHRSRIACTRSRHGSIRAVRAVEPRHARRRSIRSRKSARCRAAPIRCRWPTARRCR